MLAPKTSKETKIYDENEEQIGGRVAAKIAKNKVARPFKVAEYNLRFDRGVLDAPEELLDVGVLSGLIERPNNRSYEVNGVKLTSRKDAIQFMTENYDELHEQVRSSYMMKHTDSSSTEGYEEEVLSNPFILDEE
jgi:recombination protein RecA